MQKMNPKIIFSGETALYIHGLTDREYSRIEVTVPQGYNAVHLRKKSKKYEIICIHVEDGTSFEIVKAVVFLQKRSRPFWQGELQQRGCEIIMMCMRL